VFVSGFPLRLRCSLQGIFIASSYDADIVIAILDGSQVDDGTAGEIGYFYARKFPEQKIIGIRTDFRRAGESRGAVVNAMIEGSCDRIVRTREELLEFFFLNSQ
jgi:nucleoside 2-deoxyribosyltransferase